MSTLFIKLLLFYKKYLSLDTGKLWGLEGRGRMVCCMIPTCSTYAIEALEKYGAIKGLYLSLRRVLRCHPWQKNFYDPLR